MLVQLQTRVPLAWQIAWASLAGTSRVSSGELLRQVVATVLRGDTTPLPVAEAAAPKLDGRLQARVTDETKAAWVQRANAAGIDAGAMLRAAVHAVLSRNPSDNAGEPQPVSAGEPAVQVKVPLRLHERDAVDRAAAALGWRRNTWVASVIRTAVFQEPRPTDRELQVLHRSNGELLALGRNLNQIARALHKDDRYKSSVTLARIDELRTAIDTHVNASNALLEAIEHRWNPAAGFRPETR